MSLGLNCWEFTRCGREPGRGDGQGGASCSALTDTRSHGSNGGTHAGRICWAVAGTFSIAKPAAPCDVGALSCADCDFFKRVREEEGKGFRLLPPEGGVEGAERGAPLQWTRAMVVGSSLAFRHILRNLLAAEGIEMVWEGASGTEALARFREIKPDLVVLDLVLAEMDGLEATREMVRLDPEAQVFLCSHFTGGEVLKQVRAVGAAGFLTKPLVREEVRSVLREAARTAAERAPTDPRRRSAEPDRGANGRRPGGSPPLPA